jgi:Fe-S-cluster-containing dehydrogenase component
MVEKNFRVRASSGGGIDITQRITRRQLLCSTGNNLIVLVSTRVAWGCGGQDRDAREDGRYAQALILCDPALCAACGLCAITCSSLNAGGPSGSSALVSPDAAYQERLFDNAGWYAATCRMCPEIVEDGQMISPSCVASCPQGAAQIAAEGDAVYGDSRVRFIDPELCIGCGSCVDSCPHGHPLLEEGKARKCDLCLGRWDFPPCVDACPCSALVYVSPWSDEPPRPFDWE